MKKERDKARKKVRVSKKMREGKRVNRLEREKSKGERKRKRKKEKELK